MNTVIWSKTATTSTTRRYNFFKNLIDQAFENDSNLSNVDKRQGMLVGPGEEEEETRSYKNQELTATQQAWRQRQQSLKQVTYDDILLLSNNNRQIQVDLYLTGVPNKDPSNDLYGSRTNISSRDKSIGLTVPTEPTVSNVIIEFLNNNKCQVISDNNIGFAIIGSKNNNKKINDDDTEYMIGDWKLSDDGTQIRFRFGVNGYKRTIETKGTIQKVFWSKDDEATTQTSTIYTIPRGWIYGECKVFKQIKNNNMVQIEYDTSSSLLKIEQSTGLLGVSTKMIPCGKFIAKTTLTNPNV